MLGKYYIGHLRNGASSDDDVDADTELTLSTWVASLRKIKADSRDASILARFLRRGDLVEVFVPDEATSAIARLNSSAP